MFLFSPLIIIQLAPPGTFEISNETIEIFLENILIYLFFPVFYLFLPVGLVGDPFNEITKYQYPRLAILLEIIITVIYTYFLASLLMWFGRKIKNVFRKKCCRPKTLNFFGFLEKKIKFSACCNKLEKRLRTFSPEKFMKISTYWAWQTPKNLKGAVVIIDVYRMTTNLSLLLAKKPAHLLIVNEKNFQKAKKVYKKTLLLGESPIFPLSKFRATYPQQMVKKDFKDKTLLYMTLNGSRMFEKFYQEGRMVVGVGINNLKAVIGFLKKEKKVAIIMAGDRGREIEDDKITAEILEKELRGKRYDWQREKERMITFFKSYYSPKKVRDESIPFIFDRSVYNIVPVCQRNHEGFLEIFDKIE